MLYSAPLPSRALLRLDGSDVIHFLQNLVTCDVEGLEPGMANFGALLTPQGKILFDFFLLRDGDGFLLEVEALHRDALAKRLTFYKLRADVQIAMDDRKVFISWGGRGGEHGGGEQGDGDAESGSSSETTTEFADPRLAELGQRFYAATAQTNSSESDWHAHRIELGVPHSGLDFALGDAFPHEALMDQLAGDKGGVDFTKGCYVGQEVVSRMQHRGTARNRFVNVSSEQPLTEDLTGQALTADEKRIGTMGTISGRQGLALVRVDRASSAITADKPVLLNGEPVQLAPAAFAQFPWLT